MARQLEQLSLDLTVRQRRRREPATPNEAWLARARSIALIACIENKVATIADIHARCPLDPGMPASLMGAVFRCDKFEAIARTRIMIGGILREVQVYALRYVAPI